MIYSCLDGVALLSRGEPADHDRPALCAVEYTSTQEEVLYSHITGWGHPANREASVHYIYELLPVIG